MPGGGAAEKTGHYEGGLRGIEVEDTRACGAAVLQGRQTIIANSGDEYSFDSTFVF